MDIKLKNSEDEMITNEKKHAETEGTGAQTSKSTEANSMQSDAVESFGAAASGPSVKRGGLRQFFSRQKASAWITALLISCTGATMMNFLYARDLWVNNIYEYQEIRAEIQDTTGMLCLIALAVLALGAFALPALRRLRRESPLVQGYPAELAFAMIPVGFYLPVFASEICFDYASGSGYFYVLGFDFLILLVFYGVWLLSCLSLLQMLDMGVRAYIREKFFCIRNGARILSAIVRGAKQFWHDLTTIRLDSQSDRWLIKLVSCNFLILFIISQFCAYTLFADLLLCYRREALRCFFWCFLVLAVYSAVLFHILRKHLNRAKEQYQALLKAAKQLADGNLKGEMPDNPGLFEALADELSRISCGFQTAVEKEIRSQAMKTELVTNVSHDLKTPLTAIITYVNLLKDESISEEERRSYIEILDRKSERLKKLIEDLFEVSKASSGDMEIKKSRVDLGEMVRQAVSEQSELLAAAGIDCRVLTPTTTRKQTPGGAQDAATVSNTDMQNAATVSDRDASPAYERILLDLDPEKTYRILENLLVNVSKYALAGTRAWVQLEYDANAKEAVITVKNTSAEELYCEDTASWTERFVRGDKARNTEGSGLGLAIVKNFTELQGGQFTIETDGDLFKAIVQFPCAGNGADRVYDG
ncbi:MAG: HAMP domain-containing histidine kinase [Clostridiales bacterium]|nr:HAMP domain-containing histidine kinase [Clostridiales bacterium]